MVRDLIALCRPKHWLKNAFVFMPVPFAVAAGAHLDPGVFALGLFAFCLAASAVYAFNDARDAERDRLHVRKRHRPVAAGRISQAAAFLLSGVLALVSLAMAYSAAGDGAAMFIVIYFAINVVYSIGGRDVPLLDVFLLSAGFVLRVLFGCALLAVVASNWLLLCSSALALFLSLAKRRSDLVKGADATYRPSLSGYTASYLEQAMSIMAGMCIIAYALYLRDARVFVPGREFASLPFVVFGVLDYLRVAHVRDEGDNPVDLLVRAPSMWLAALGWAVATLWGLSF